MQYYILTRYFGLASGYLYRVNFAPTIGRWN
jgi:hypothetical protein